MKNILCQLLHEILNVLYQLTSSVRDHSLTCSEKSARFFASSKNIWKLIQTSSLISKQMLLFSMNLWVSLYIYPISCVVSHIFPLFWMQFVDIVVDVVCSERQKRRKKKTTEHAICAHVFKWEKSRRKKKTSITIANCRSFNCFVLHSFFNIDQATNILWKLKANSRAQKNKSNVNIYPKQKKEKRTRRCMCFNTNKS